MLCMSMCAWVFIIIVLVKNTWIFQKFSDFGIISYFSLNFL
jgi:hypothetical protein